MGKIQTFGLIFVGFALSCTVNTPPPLPKPLPFWTGQASSAVGPANNGQIRQPNPGGSLQDRDQPFPYQINIDTISYMGCPDPSATDPIFTSFKLGSYSKGVSLTEEFKKQFTAKSPQQKESLIRSSPFINSRGQISINGRGNIQNLITIENQPVIRYFPPITNPQVVSDLAREDVSRSMGVNHSIEEILPLSGNILHHILSFLARSHHITLTYNNGSSSQPLGPGRNQYYGRSYQIDFDQNLSYMTGVKEYNLLTGKQAARWSCSKKSKLMILRHNEISAYQHQAARQFFEHEGLAREAICAEDKSALSASQMETVENLLPANLFVIGYVKTWETDEDGLPELKETKTPCLTTQTSHWSCYSQSKTRRVEWDENQCQTNDPNIRCPAYFSFCTS